METSTWALCIEIALFGALIAGLLAKIIAILEDASGRAESKSLLSRVLQGVFSKEENDEIRELKEAARQNGQTIEEYKASYAAGDHADEMQ